MSTLANLSNPTGPVRGRRRRKGRGPASGVGKTAGRGMKGAGARSGYKRRLTYEGGQMRLFRKLPTRGFTRGRFQKPHAVINLRQVERYFGDGDTVTNDTLLEKGLISNLSIPVKLLGTGEITKRLAKVQLHDLSASAKEKLEQAKVPFEVLERKGARRARTKG